MSDFIRRPSGALVPAEHCIRHAEACNLLGFGSMIFAGGGAGVSTATWNPSDKGAVVTLSGGNLTAANAGTSGGVSSGSVRATVPAGSTDKIYFEYLINTANNLAVGIANGSADMAQSAVNDTNIWGYWNSSGAFYNGGSPATGYATYTSGDVIGIAIDCANNRLWFAKNNVWQTGDPATGTTPAFGNLTGTIYPCVGSLYDNWSVTARFSQTAWAYAAPTGFTNLP